MTEKFTDKDFYEAVLAAMGNNADVVAKATAKLQALEAKAEKAKQKAAEKASQPDVLEDAVADVLTDEPMTLADVLAAVTPTVPDATLGKVSNRLTKLKNAGRAVKTEVTVEGTDGKKAKRSAYTLPTDAQ